MHYPSVFSAALLALPAVLASPIITAAPLEARATSVPTCNANNVAIFKSDYPSSSSFCSSWNAQPTHTKSPITQLQVFQISNICKCILAPTYVASPALSTSSISKTSSSSVSSSSVSSTKSSPTSSKTSSSSVSSTKSSSTSSKSSSSSISSTKSSSTASKTSSSSIATTKSSSIITTSSPSVSSTTTFSSTSTAVPSAFNIYIGNVSATTGGVPLQGSATWDSIGLFPTPTPYVAPQVARKRSTSAMTTTPYVASACVPGVSYVHGTEYFTVCNSTDTVDSTTGVTQPGSLDNITTLAGCIYFCDEQGSECAGASFNQEAAAGTQQCQLFSTFSSSNIVAAPGSLSHLVYKAAEVPTLSFDLDPGSGYIYANDNSGNVLAWEWADNDVASLVIAPLGDCYPATCSVDAHLRLTCTAGGFYWGVEDSAFELSTPDATTGEQDLSLYPGSSSRSTVGLYLVAVTNSSSTSPYKYTNGNNTILLTTSDFVNEQNTTTTGASLNTTTSGDVTMNFAVSGSTASTVLVVDDIPLFEGDTYRFTSNITFTYGALPANLQCIAGLSFADDNTVSNADYASSITFDSTFPTQFEILFEGTTEVTDTVPVSFSISCSEVSGSQVLNFPIAINSITFESDPTTATGAVLPANSDGQVFVQYYSGSNTQLTTVTGDAIVSGPTPLYVADQAAAVTSCASTAGMSGAFEVYLAGGAWNCVVFTEAFASSSLFATANTDNTQVVGYYRSALLSA